MKNFVWSRKLIHVCGGGGPGSQDSDGDGLDDLTEEAGWYVYWYDSSGGYHWDHITSNTNKKDTDGDGLWDNKEYKYQLNPRNGDTDGDGMSDYYEVNYGKPAGGWQEPHYYNHRYAVIIVGGGYRIYYDSGDYDKWYPAFWNDAKAMYDKLVDDYHYLPENVYLMSSAWYCKYPDSDQGDWFGHNIFTDSIVDGEAMWNVSGVFDIKDALDDISNKITVHDSLMIVFVTHGWKNNFDSGVNVLENTSNPTGDPSSQWGAIVYSDFGNYINTTFGNGNSRKYAVMIVVNQACHSGSMMHYLYGTNRILVSAADSEHEAWTEAAWPPFQQPYEHFAFIYQGRMKEVYDNGQFFFPTYDGFILSMGDAKNPNSVSYMYQSGDYAEHHNGNYYDEYCSYPMIVYSGVNPDKIYL